MAEPSKLPQRLTVVMRGPSAVFLAEGTPLCVKNLRLDQGDVEISFRTRWIKKGNTVTLPGDLWIEISGRTSVKDIEKAINPFANAGMGFLPIIALSANAAIGEFDVEIAFDSTPGTRDRYFFQSYIPQESPNEVHFCRRLDVELTVALLRAIGTHPDGERLRRAAAQYQHALGFWGLGRDTLSLAHLWMALEALTPVRLRAECLSKGLPANTRQELTESKQKLAVQLGVEAKKLEPAIRQNLLLAGDKECYARAKDASDGFEHGYLPFDEIREHAKAVRHRLANFVRTAIFDLANLHDEMKSKLLGEPFGEPRGYWPPIKYLRGKLIGDAKDLAAAGNAYPMVQWRHTVEAAGIDDAGKLSVQVNESLTRQFGDGVQFEPQSREVWRPG